MNALAKKSPAWLATQSRTIGGSTAAQAVGQSRYGTPAELYDVMTGAAAPKDLSGNPDARRGLLLEPLARELLADKLGPITPHPQENFLRNDAYPWSHALPDGWYAGQPIEIKCPRPHTLGRIVLEDRLPAEWYIQAMHNLAVTGAEVLHFGLLDPIAMTVLHVPVESDAAFIAGLMDAEAAFWRRVRDRDRPADEPPLGAPTVEVPPLETGRKFARLETLEADNVAWQLLRAKELKAEAEEFYELAKARVVELMGDCDCIEVPSARLRVYHAETAGRRTLNTEKAIQDCPQLRDETYWKTGKPYKSFRAYELKGKNDA